jgi:hypothetical protein
MGLAARGWNAPILIICSGMLVTSADWSWSAFSCSAARERRYRSASSYTKEYRKRQEKKQALRDVAWRSPVTSGWSAEISTNRRAGTACTPVVSRLSACCGGGGSHVRGVL